jgi:septal ring factor EnvC (AmiA/AmiB activator)
MSTITKEATRSELVAQKRQFQQELKQVRERSTSLRAQLVSSYADEEELLRGIRKIDDRLRGAKGADPEPGGSENA